MIQQTQTKIELAQIIKAQLINCIGFEGDELQKAREQAYNYYFQRARGDEIEGRSSIVTGDLSSMVEGNLAQMTEPLSCRRIAEYCAYDGPDEEQAATESDCVNDLVFNKQNGFIQITASIKDAMLLRNAVAKVYIDERTYRRTINKENVNPEIVQELTNKIEQQQSVKGVAVSVEVHKYDRENKKYSATVTKVSKKFTLESVAPENLLVLKTWDKHNFDGCPFLAERHVEPRSTLIERGFQKSIVNELPAYKSAQNQLTQQARLPFAQSNTNNPTDRSQDLLEWYECYVEMDDGDGAAELHLISICGSIILDDEPVEDNPYCAGVIFLNPHSYVGISLHDKLKSTQDSTTALTRALMDNLNTTTKNRTAHFDGIVEETDVTDGRTNGSIRVKPGVGITDVRAAITGFSVPDTSGNILQNLESFRRTRSEMGGASLDMATGQAQLSDRVGSMGLDRAYSVMEQLASFMTKTIANTLIREIYLKAHKILRTEWQGPVCFKRGNQWIQQDPSKWQSRDSVVVNLGSSLNERARQSAVLEKVMAKQEALAQVGMEGILVDANTYWQAFMEWMRVNDLKTPERFSIDPRSEGAQKEMRAKAVRSQQQQQKQDALLQQAAALEQIRIAIDKYKADQTTQFNYWKECIEAQIEESKLTVSGLVDILKARSDANKAEENGSDKSSTGTDKSSSKKPEGESSMAADSE